MASRKNGLMSRATSFLLSILLVLGMLPANVLPVFAASEANYGTFSCITDGGSVSDASGSSPVATYTGDITLKWSQADASAGRTADGWWIGVKMTAPADMTGQDDFDKVTYQTQVGAGWSEAKSFWNAQDSDKNVPDTARYLTMWGLVTEEFLNNALLEDTLVTYAWQFDWDGDGSYEQVATLKIDPKNITLVKGDQTVYPSTNGEGTQVYPPLGTVSTITGGTVEGSGTGNVTVTADDLCLDWSEADPEIGRNVDGWWAGIKITAPSWVDLTNKDVNYQSKVGDADWSGDKSFNTNKDTDDCMTMWTVLTPEKLAEGKNIVASWKFDWDGDGEYEQAVEFIIVPGNITLNKVAQTDFAFENPSPKNEVITEVWTGTTYNNPASGGQSGGEITYSIIDGEEFASVDANGILTFKTEYLKTASVDVDGVVGTVTVKAVLKGNDVYKDAETEYTITIYKRTTPGIDFEYGDASVTYEPGLTHENQAKHSEAGKDGIKYEIVESTDLDGNNLGINDVAKIDENTGKLTIKRSGIVTVRATRPEDALYTESTATYMLTVNKADQTIGEETGFRFNDGETVEKTWSKTDSENYYFNEAIGGESSGDITYTVVSIDEMLFGGPCAAFNDDTLAIYGKGTVVIQAVKAGDDRYNDSEEITYTLTISGAEQDTLEFHESVPTKVTYNDNDNKYQLATVGGSGNGTVTYTVISGDAVTINGDQLTVVKAGTVTIKAVKAATNTYDAAEVTLEIVIEKAEQSIEFEDKTTTSIIYGNPFTNAASPVTVSTVPDEKGYAAQTTITYQVIEGSEIASVDDNGILTFKNNAVGTVKIEATKLGDDCYKDTSVTYTLEVKYLDQPDVPYTLSGDQKNESGWYTGNVTITPAAGYQISFSNDLTDNEWKNDLSVSTEGYNGKTVYLKNSEGISGAIEISENDIRIDKTAPSQVEISYSQSLFDLVLETVTFGFYQAPVTVTVTAFDETSHIDLFKYAYNADFENGEFDGVIDSNSPKFEYDDAETTATATFEIAAQYRGSVSVKAIDTAGNTSEPFIDEKVIVVDTVAPGVTVTFDNNEALNDTYYKADRTATITISEANFFVEAFDKVENIAFDPSVMVDEHLVITVTKVLNDGTQSKQVFKNEDLTIPFTKTAEDTWTATLLFDENADYIFEIVYKDFSGNEAVVAEYQKSFTIDKTAPIMSISYDNNSALNEDHYKNERTATITIVEHNFRASDIVVDPLTAVDIQGNPVPLTRDYQEFLRTGNWISDGDTHTLEVPFDVDARYKFTISYSDLAGNPEEKKIEDEFCIDKLAPAADSLKVSYSTSVLDTILETITFGFYKAPATVTIEADDGISGVDYFTYSYIVSEGESSTNVGKSNVDIPNEEITFSDGGKHAKASFEIPAQFRGNVTFTATDRAGNTSALFKDEKVIVVDDVLPGIKVEYDNDDASYETFYKESRTATITINEANFFVEAFEKVEDISENPSVMIDEHLIITVTKETNDGQKTSKIYKNADLTSPFTKTAEDTWTASLLFDEDADYTWTIEYTDFSGNIAGTFKDSFTVDNIDPQISVSHSNNSAKNGFYFKEDRPVTIVITEHNFNAADVVVKVTSNKATDTVTDFAAYLKNPNNWTSVGDVHTANIRFETEADYTFDIQYTDQSGRGNDEVDYGASVAPKSFTLDKTAPTNADITIDNESILAKNGVAFEKFYRSTVVVKYTVNCDVSGLDNITYQKVDSVSAYSENASWTAFNAESGVTVSPSERFVIYFRAEDKAGNVTIVNSTGVVVDNKSPVGETYAPEIDIVSEVGNANGMHNSDVDVDLKVIDPKYAGESAGSEGYYSGLNKITYKIYTKDTDTVESGVLLDLTQNILTGAQYDENNLISGWTGKITVKAFENGEVKFNSNNIIVEITAVDNAGNERVTTNEMIGQPIKIDTTVPTIDVAYSNNDVDSDSFFKADRTATIVITERNFNPDDVVITITNTDGVIPALSGWTKAAGSGNEDDTRWTATITYSADGDYTFDIAYTDMADNKDGGAQYGNSVMPTAFTIDKMAPVIEVTYDNNSAQNDNYYKDERTATVTIREHNFNADRVEITITATDNGTPITIPTVNGWNSNGDVHTATIRYANDALYSFDIAFTDKAGNVAADFAEQRFYVDKTNPAVSITEIVDESANNEAGNIGFVITATDTNFDVFTPVLTAVVKEGDEFKTKEINVGKLSDTVNGKIYTVTNLDADGIYRITCTVVDKAGNAYSEVTLTKEDGSTYVENRFGNDTLLTFSVNRDGSTFELDQKTVDLINKYYVQNVTDDVVIVEINADPLQEYKVTLNGIELSETQYKVDHVGGEGNWEKYTYTIDKSLFEAEGEYTVVVSTRDKATNDAFSDVKDAGITFVVDRTAPVVTVTGLENDGRYQTESQTVTLVPTDDGGALKSIVVTLVDGDGNVIRELLNLSGEDFAKALEDGNGQLTFEVPEGLYQNVRIVCDDEADYGSDENIIYDETIRNVSVSSSAFMIFWANKPLRWGSIGGIGLVAVGLILLLVLKKRKKKEN